MDDILREWAEMLRSAADEMDSVADRIRDGIFVSPEDIERLTSGQMVPNVQPYEQVHATPTPTPPTMPARADEVYYMSEAQRNESYVVHVVETQIKNSLRRGLTAQVQYQNGKTQWFRPTQADSDVMLQPW